MPPGTNSAAVGLRGPLLRAVFREGACMSSAMLKLQHCEHPTLGQYWLERLQISSRAGSELLH